MKFNFIRLLLVFSYLLFHCISCAPIDNYKIKIPEKDFSSITTKINKVVTDQEIIAKKKNPNGGSNYHVEFMGVYITDIIKTVFGKILVVPYVINSDVYDDDKKIDLLINKKVSHNELKNITKRALNVAGYDVIEFEGCLYISRSKQGTEGKITTNYDEKKVFAVRQLQNIKPDTLQKRIYELLKTDIESLKIYADTSSDLFFFSVAEKDLKKVDKIIIDCDVPEKQVYLELIIYEANRSGILKNGLSGYLSTAMQGVKAAFLPALKSVSELSQFSFITDPNIFNIIIGVLEEESLIYKIASPHLLVKSGQKAELSVGDQIPALSSTTVTNDTTEQNIVYKSTGIILSAKVDIVANNINIDLSIELSSGDINKLSSINSPSISSRSIKSSLICENSKAILIGGLYQDNSIFKNSGLPIHNSIVKNYINENNREENKTEIIVYIRPVIMQTDINDLILNEKLKDYQNVN